MKPPLVYFCSEGVGENLQASGAMRQLKRDHHLIVVCKQNPSNVLHPDCYSELVTFTGDNFPSAIVKLKKMLAEFGTPVPWTAHLDPYEFILEALQDKELIAEFLPRRAPPWPCSAALAFWGKTVRFIDKKDSEHIPGPDKLRMTARFPDNQRVGDYDFMVSMGSAESMRRLPESVAVGICNRLNRNGHRVVLHGAMARPVGLHSQVATAQNRWSDGSIHQLMDLMYGIRALVSPDSGPAHLALAYGKKVLFLESREHYNAVVDASHHEQAFLLRLPDPACDKACSARRPDFDTWPAAGSATAAPGYPFNLACSKFGNVPCLTFSPEQIEALCSLPIFK